MKKAKNMLIGIGFGILCLILSTAAALGLLHGCDLLYRATVDGLHLPETTGYSREVILRNYRDVMRYLSPFHGGDFELSDLRFSAGGAQHFADVKAIFNGVYLAGAVSLLGIAVILTANKRRRRDFLRTSGITTLTLPGIVAVGVIINFSAIFILFHQLFFRNDLWIFDSWEDEVINILPQQFFMNCAIMIVVFWLLAAALQFWVSHRIRRKKQNQL